MSYNKYEDKDWSRERRPKSISPPDRRSNFYQNNYNKRGGSGYRRAWNHNYQHRQPHHFKPNYRKPQYNHSRGGYRPRFHHPDTDQAQKDTERSPMYLSDATQTYDTDRNTVMEVTQLLINEDKDLESRLLAAMERVLIDMKRKHDSHVELVRKTSQAT